jgi:hypothetical protein
VLLATTAFETKGRKILITRRHLLSGAAAAVAALVLSGCQIDTRAPIRASQILAVAQSGAPQPVNANVTGLFASEGWCRDESAMSIDVLSTPTVPVNLMSCTPQGKEATGVFQVTTSLVRTAGGGDDAAILQSVLAGDMARFAVYPHGKRKGLLSVGLFLDLPRLMAAKDKLAAMPVFRRGLEKDSAINLSFTVDIMNDLQQPLKVYLANVSAGGDQASDEAVMTIPPGGLDTVTLDPQTQQTLMGQGWVNFFSIPEK